MAAVPQPLVAVPASVPQRCLASSALAWALALWREVCPKRAAVVVVVVVAAVVVLVVVVLVVVVVVVVVVEAAAAVVVPSQRCSGPWRGARRACRACTTCSSTGQTAAPPAASCLPTVAAGSPLPQRVTISWRLRVWAPAWG